MEAQLHFAGALIHTPTRDAELMAGGTGADAQERQSAAPPWQDASNGNRALAYPGPREVGAGPGEPAA
jgi:hypothetical protein